MIIKRPNLFDEFGRAPDTNTCMRWLSNWFDEHVEPINKMLEEGIEVYQVKMNDGFWRERLVVDDTYKALLINIKPIQKETANELADALAKALEISQEKLGIYRSNTNNEYQGGMEYQALSDLNSKALENYKKFKEGS